MAVTATRLQGRGSRIGFDCPVSGSRATKEDDGTYRTDGSSWAGTTSGGNYGGVDQTTPMAEATAEEEALPEPEPPTTQELATETTAAFTDIQIPRWNLGKGIPIAPHVWDADTPQVEVGATEADVNIINLDDSEITPVVPETVRKSPKENRKK
jgi:hypothetical protein